MHVILHAADNDGLAFKTGQDTAEAAVQFVAQRFVAQKRSPVFGGEDRVHENFGEGLRHDGMMRETWRRFNHIECVDLSRRD